MADSHIDDSEVQLSEGSAFIKQRHILEISETARISSMDKIINPHHDSPNDGIKLQPVWGFAAYIAASLPTEKVSYSYSDTMQCPDRNKWLAAMECEMEKLTNKNV